jgi:hypothetical protein
MLLVRRGEAGEERWDGRDRTGEIGREIGRERRDGGRVIDTFIDSTNMY